MTRRNSFYILVFISTFLTGCFGFDTNTSDNIIGNYYVIAIDDSEESLNYSTNKGGGGFSTVLVDGSVYEVLWNDNFILTKQHALDKNYQIDYERGRWRRRSDVFKSGIRLFPPKRVSQ